MSLTILCGKTSSGKDHLLKILVNDFNFERIVTCTDRPKRKGETEGVEYFFKSKEEFDELIKNDGLLEYRIYNTLVNDIPDTWRYGTPKDIKLDKHKDYIMILTPDVIKKLKEVYKDAKVFYIDASYGTRHNRCILRGDYDESEWLRRKEADDKDFSDDIINQLNARPVTNENRDIYDVAKQINNFAKYV